MDHRTILATGFLLLCGAVFVQSLNTANALPQGPNVSMGSNPYQSFTGQVTSSSGATTLLTAPSDQAFMVTTLISNRNDYNSGLSSYHFCKLMIDGTLAMGGEIGHRQNNHAFSMGNAHLVVPAGSVLSIEGYGSTCHYYVEGYYIHP